MGACCTGGFSDADLKDFRRQHPEYFFPGFIEDDKVDAAVAAMVRGTWKHLLECDTEELADRKRKDRNFSPVTAFYDAFYGRLFERYPHTNRFFKAGGIQVRAKSLIQMISTALTLIDQDRWQIHVKLNFLAKFHAGKGIGPAAFIPILDAVFYALEALLTPRLFTADARHAWQTAYSKVVRVMLPMIASVASDGHAVVPPLIKPDAKHRSTTDDAPADAPAHVVPAPGAATATAATSSDAKHHDAAAAANGTVVVSKSTHAHGDGHSHVLHVAPAHAVPATAEATTSARGEPLSGAIELAEVVPPPPAAVAADASDAADLSAATRRRSSTPPAPPANEHH